MKINVIDGGGVLPPGELNLAEKLPGETGRGYGDGLTIDFRCGGSIELIRQPSPPFGAREYIVLAHSPRATAFHRAVLRAATPYGPPPQPEWWSAGTADSECPCYLCAVRRAPQA